jgi:uncharacterized RDD family membrane protein YckC
MADPSRIPEELKSRLERQRRRHKLVRFTFPVTIGVLVLLMFGMHQAYELAPTSRVVLGLAQDDDVWVLDQRFELAAQQPAGSFGLVHLRGVDDEPELEIGPRYNGVLTSITLLPEQRIGVTSGLRYSVYDLSEEGWPRTEFVNLGVDDPDAGPVVAAVDGVEWLVWARGRDVLLRPARYPQVTPFLLHRARNPRPVLAVRTVRDRLWLSMREAGSGDVMLVALEPRVLHDPEDEAEPAVELTLDDITAVPDPDANDDPEPLQGRAGAVILQRMEVVSGVRNSSFTVLAAEDFREDIPVVSYNLRDESSWNMRYRRPGSERWQSADIPPRDTPASRMATSNFLTVTARDGRVLAFYNDANDVKLAVGRLADEGLEWDEPRLLEFDSTRDPTALYILMGLMLVVSIVAATQVAWMLLNKERPEDRRLLDAIEARETAKPGKGKKGETPRLYAGGLPRALALLLDIALTSPIIILLQDVYGYEWSQAYGFLAIGSVPDAGASILLTMQATVVTLLVLAVYGSVCELVFGKTFGKSLFRLRVIDGDGERPAAWRIVVRNAVKVFELIHWLVLIVPMALMLVTGKQQRLGDLLAGTFVVLDVVPEESPDDLDV